MGEWGVPLLAFFALWVSLVGMGAGRGARLLNPGKPANFLMI